MLSNHNISRKKLSFVYSITHQFNNKNDYYTGNSENSLRRQKAELMVKYLKNECTHQEIQDIDDKLEAQTKLQEDTYIHKLFSPDDLKNYDANFLKLFAFTHLNIDPFGLFENVPIFEIENMKIYAHMPNVDDHGNIYLNEKRVDKVDVCINVTIITTDIDFRDLENYVKRAIVTMSTKGIDVESYDIQHIDDVTTDYVIIDSIKEKNSQAYLRGYFIKANSSEPQAEEFDKIKTEFAKRLYCGKAWTLEALDFANAYYHKLP